MTDSTLNRFLSSGTTAERTAFTPSPPTPASGPDPGYLWWDTDLQEEFAYDFGLADWVSTSGAGSLPALTDGKIWIGNGTNVAVARTPTGDITVSNTGVTAIGAGKVTPAMLSFTPAEVLLATSSPTGTGTVTFSSISQSYKDLRLVVRGRTTASAVFADVAVTFNGDSGANYDFEYLIGSGTAATVGGSRNQTSMTIGTVSGATGASADLGTIELTIYDYTNASDNKTATSTIAVRVGTSSINENNIQERACWWHGTPAAIVNMTVTLSNGNYTNSTLSLYGRNG